MKSHRIRSFQSSKKYEDYVSGWWNIDIEKLKKMKIDYDIRELQREMNWFEEVKKKDPSYNYSKKYYKHYKEMMQEMGKLKSQRKKLK